jgi:hypothetical protein
MEKSIIEILHFANPRIRDLLNIHNMKEWKPESIIYEISYLEDKENRVTAQIENELKQGFVDLPQIKYEILYQRRIDTAPPRGARSKLSVKLPVENSNGLNNKMMGGKSTYPYIVFEENMNRIGMYTFFEKRKNNLASQLFSPLKNSNDTASENLTGNSTDNLEQKLRSNNKIQKEKVGEYPIRVEDVEQEQDVEHEQDVDHEQDVEQDVNEGIKKIMIRVEFYG